jgi:hypothetical protein
VSGSVHRTPLEKVSHSGIRRVVGNAGRVVYRVETPTVGVGHPSEPQSAADSIANLEVRNVSVPLDKRGGRRRPNSPALTCTNDLGRVTRNVGFRGGGFCPFRLRCKSRHDVTCWAVAGPNFERVAVEPNYVGPSRRAQCLELLVREAVTRIQLVLSVFPRKLALSVVNASDCRRVPAVRADPCAVGKAFAAYAAIAHTFLKELNLVHFWPAEYREFWPTNHVDGEDEPYWYNILDKDDVCVGEVF